MRGVEMAKLKKLVPAFEQAKGRPPTVEEVARAMGWGVDQARSALAALEPAAASPTSSQPPPAAAAPAKPTATKHQNDTGSIKGIAKPKPGTVEARAWGRLRKRGQVPTARAVAAEVQRLEAEAAARKRLAQHVAVDGPRAAAWVAQYWADHGVGPLWRELAAAMDWPLRRDRFNSIIRGLGRAGWLAITDGETRSLRPGARAAGSADGAPATDVGGATDGHGDHGRERHVLHGDQVA